MISFVLYKNYSLIHGQNRKSVYNGPNKQKMINYKLLGVTGWLFQILSLRIVLTLTNSVDSDEMLHYTAFHLGLHCFS